MIFVALFRPTSPHGPIVIPFFEPIFGSLHKRSLSVTTLCIGSRT
jgi:hypothetical protein